MSVTVSKVLTKVFGSRNDRLLKRYRKIVEQINALEPQMRAKTDEELRARTEELRAGIAAGTIQSADVLPEAFAIIRESMDRNIGIRSIFNPDENFDPDQFDDQNLELYDAVQRHMIATGVPWTKVSIPPKLYEAVRKLIPDSRPPFRARCFDVQVIGGLVLYEGKIAEMATGEGKTFVAPLACFMKVLEGHHCHVVTVNDYLVRRDANWIRPAFEALGLSVGFVQQEMEPGGDARRRAYQCDVTYGMNSEFGFDYLRDNMKERADLQVQKHRDFAIVDEVDSILIDEARTPLIISGAAHDDAQKYRAADAVARKVIELNKSWDAAEKNADAAKRAIKAAEGDYDKAKGSNDRPGMDAAQKRREEAEKALQAAEVKKKDLTQYYEVELDRKSVHLTHEGIAAAQEAAGVGSFYVGNNMEWPHLMEQALRAHVVYERDRDYVVERGQTGQMEIVIVDEYTGRKMVGRQWSDGLHQAIEAKERVPIKQETQTLATITLQNFFKLYKFLAGMTGTAQTEAEEFSKIYRLEVVTIPTNRPAVRQDNEDRVYRTEREKWEAIIDEIKEYSDAGRPVLVGTTSVEKSEMLSNLLKRKYGIEHEVLNAKQHEREAQIVVKAGQTHVNAFGQSVGNVTIATNMAGRGTDIKLAPEVLWEVRGKQPDGKAQLYELVQNATAKIVKVKDDEPTAGVFQFSSPARVVGGLHVIGTERHTARRIDNQLRGRSGRQGDPGSSRFYVSLQDDLMKMFAGEWTIRVLGWLGMEEGMAIEDKRISKGILRAQKKVEERNFLARKNLLDYDEVMDHQRTHFYGMRQQVLDGRDVDQIIWNMIGESIEDAVGKYIGADYIASVIAEWARANFEVTIEPEDLRGLRRIEDLESYIKGQARADAETSIPITMGEYMGEDPDNPAEWDVKGLAAWALSRYQVKLTPAEIRGMESIKLEETLREAAIEQIEQRDCAGLVKYLEPLYAERELCEWAAQKFGIQIKPEEVMLDVERKIRKPADEIISLIEQHARAAYAVRELEYPIDHVLTFVFGGAQQNGENPYAADQVRGWARFKYGVDMSLDQVRGLPLPQLRDELIGLQKQFLHDGKLQVEVDALIQAHPTPQALAQAVNQRFNAKLSAEDLAPQASNGDGEAVGARETILKTARRFLRQELSDLEQFVLIQIFDQSWKDHLYAMDVLKASIGLHAFAERDPRVLYKKEGYRYFQEMMAGIRDKVTDLIFRARLMGAAQARNAYNITAATHQDTGGYGVAENVRATADAVPVGDGEMQQAASQAQGEGAKVKTIVREAPKVGRNDLCPCGSGKKYKKCCGINEV